MIRFCVFYIVSIHSCLLNKRFNYSSLRVGKEMSKKRTLAEEFMILLRNKSRVAGNLLNLYRRIYTEYTEKHSGADFVKIFPNFPNSQRDFVKIDIENGIAVLPKFSYCQVFLYSTV